MSSNYEDDIYDPADIEDSPATWRDETPVLHSSELEVKAAPEYGSCMLWPVLPQYPNAQPLQILPRRLRRERANIHIHMITAGTVVFNSNQQALMGPNPQGYTMNIGANTSNDGFPDWKAQQPLYAVSSAVDTAISVIDQSYSER